MPSWQSRNGGDRLTASGLGARIKAAATRAMEGSTTGSDQKPQLTGEVLRVLAALGSVTARTGELQIGWIVGSAKTDRHDVVDVVVVGEHGPAGPKIGAPAALDLKKLFDVPRRERPGRQSAAVTGPGPLQLLAKPEGRRVSLPEPRLRPQPPQPLLLCRQPAVLLGVLRAVPGAVCGVSLQPSLVTTPPALAGSRRTTGSPPVSGGVGQLQALLLSAAVGSPARNTLAAPRNPQANMAACTRLTSEVAREG